MYVPITFNQAVHLWFKHFKLYIQKTKQAKNDGWTFNLPTIYLNFFALILYNLPIFPKNGISTKK